MKMKQYRAEDMRTALRMVREAQGADAVILSSRRIAGGVEVVAAVDYDGEDAATAKLEQSLPPQAPRQHVSYGQIAQEQESTWVNSLERVAGPASASPALSNAANNMQRS